MNPQLKFVNVSDLDESQAYKMAYYHFQPKQQIKATVLCLHALTHNGRMFDFLAKDLCENGYEVICPDTLGRGESDYLLDKTHYGYPLYVKNFFQLIDALNLKKIILIGTSMGGIISTMICGSDRNKKENIVQKLVLNDVGPFIPKQAIARISQYIGARNEFEDLEAQKRLLKIVFKDFGLFDEQIHEDHFFEFYIKKLENGKYNLNYDPAIALAYVNKRGKPRMAFDFSYWEVWEKINCDVMIIRGENSDLLLQETLAKMCENHFVKKTLVINGVGHAPMLMKQTEIEEIKEFIQKAK